MMLLSSDLRERDVINVCSGKRLGCVSDFELDTDCGKIVAILVSDRMFSFGSGKGCVRVCWEQICCIGKDAVLVQLKDGTFDTCCDDGKDKKRIKRVGNWFFG